MKLPSHNQLGKADIKTGSGMSTHSGWDPLRVQTQGKSAEAVVGELLCQADARNRAKDLAVHLVSAKLSLRFDREMPVSEVTKPDGNSKFYAAERFGHFEIENSILEVAIGLPDAKSLRQIDEALKNSRREVWLLTRDDRVTTWKNETSQRLTRRKLARLVVRSVESFVGQNITELGEFSAAGKAEQFKKLIELYNTRWVETIGASGISISME